MKRVYWVLLAIVAVALGITSTAQDSFDWRRFEGSNVTVLISEHPVTNGMRAVVDQFTAETGITVTLDAMAENLYFDRMELALRANEGVADVYFQPMDSTAYTQYSNGLVKSLSPYLNDPTMTSPDYDLADFPAGFLVATEYPPDAEVKENYGIPVSFEAYILFYNKDLVDQYLGGVVPTTMPELVAAAAKINADSGGTVAGAVMRGIRSHTIMDTVTGMVFNEFGDKEMMLPGNVWFEGDWTKPQLTNPAVYQGLADYAGMMSGGPANIQALDWPDASLLFSQGKAAFFIDASLFGPGFEDPNASAVAGKIGYAPLPPATADAESRTGHWMWGLGIPANSKNPEAAWYFIQWMTSKAIDPIIGGFHGGAARLTTWENPVYTEKLNAEYVATVQEVMKTSKTTVVFRENWTEYALAIADVIQNIYGGMDPAEAAQIAQDQIAALVTAAGN